MLDMIGAIAGTAVYAVIVGILIGWSTARRPTKLRLFTAAGGWGALIVTLGAVGAFEPGAIGPIPAPVLAFVGFLALLAAAWARWPEFRRALLGVPLPALLALNVARLGGIAFILLTASGRLSEPFGPVAGVGDMAVAALAIPLAVRAAGEAVRAGWLKAWNVAGALDLVVAISLGLLSAPGTPLQIFTDGPGSLAMTSLPWVMVPALLVPLFLLIHVTIAAKLAARPHPAVAVAR